MSKNDKNKWLVVGNWKMNPISEKLAKQLFSSVKKSLNKLKNTEVVICPPFVYMQSIKSSSVKLSIGSQDSFPTPEGSHTGEISYLMLKNLGIKYSIIGHSEKRQKGETDESVNQKVKSCLRGMITPIVCVGELTREGTVTYLLSIKEQIQKALAGLSKSSVKDIVIAYEPVWAIGENAKREPEPREIFEVVIYIKKVISDLYGTKSIPPTKILYGGSVNESNVFMFLKESGVDGFLIGRASLDAKKFNEILIKIDGIKR